jgi:hypothetical protein
MLDSINLTTRAAIERACDAAGRLGLPQLPLFRAAADGLICLISIYDPTAPWPAALIERNAWRPTLVLIGADPGYGQPDPAPEEWAAANRLRYWCRAAMVHGAGGTADHYREAAGRTLLASRFALIETTSARAHEWAAFLKCPRTQLILPADGAPHPIPEKVVMQ